MLFEPFPTRWKCREGEGGRERSRRPRSARGSGPAFCRAVRGGSSERSPDDSGLGKVRPSPMVSRSSPERSCQPAALSLAGSARRREAAGIRAGLSKPDRRHTSRLRLRWAEEDPCSPRRFAPPAPEAPGSGMQRTRASSPAPRSRAPCSRARPPARPGRHEGVRALTES